MSVFSRFEPRLQHAIVQRLGWSSLTSRNAVILAPTSGGKTEASMFPALSGTVAELPELYIAPIKALLNNQAERLGLYTEMVGMRRFVWYGDTPSNERRKVVREPAELLMTTPESLEVMLVSQTIDAPKLFGDLRVVVFDEIHALVDGVSCFMLGGRAWAVLLVQHEDRRVVVESAPRGRQPTWGGF